MAVLLVEKMKEAEVLKVLHHLKEDCYQMVEPKMGEIEGLKMGEIMVRVVAEGVHHLKEDC